MDNKQKDDYNNKIIEASQKIKRIEKLIEKFEQTYKINSSERSEIESLTNDFLESINSVYSQMPSKENMTPEGIVSFLRNIKENIVDKSLKLKIKERILKLSAEGELYFKMVQVKLNNEKALKAHIDNLNSID